jgi:integrase/recombinase XerD
VSPPKMLARIEEYVALRRGLGFSMAGTAGMLRCFARFAERVGHKGPLTVDLAVRWAEDTESKSPAVPTQRMGALRGFARHRAAFDAATEIPPRGLLAHPTVHKSPHIYSDAEVAALLGAASRHLYPRGGVRPLVYRTLFALLAATGLRISEARGLACRDVDLREGVLRVRAGKNGKERIVPLHPSAIEPLREYASRRDASSAVRRSDSFFRTERAASLGRTDPAKTFARLRQALGWSAAGRARVPRIHDLRHTFAVRRLLCWCAEGVDVHRKIAALSTYLGHCKVSDTYWYLSAVPELMAYAGGRFERFALDGAERAT